MILNFIIVIALYAAGAGLNIGLRQLAFKTGLMNYDSMDSDVAHVMFSLIWPIYMPALITYMIISSAPKIKIPKLKKEKDELFKGVPKPSNILNGMVAARVLQNFEDLRVDHGDYYVYRKNNIDIEFCVRGKDVTVYRFKVNNKGFTPTKEFEDSMLKAVELHRAKEAADLEYLREENALQAIESL